MAILSTIGRRSLSARLLIGTMYALLLVGAVTMVYPFLLMLSGSTKSATDVQENRVIPPFLADQRALYQKHIEGLFNEALVLTRCTYDLDISAFEKLDPPAAPNRAMVEQWKSFIDQAKLPFQYYSIGYIIAPNSRGVQPYVLRDFRRKIQDRFHDDLQETNRALGTEFAQWSTFYVLPEDYTLRRSKPGNNAFDLAFRSFKEDRPFDERSYISIDGSYKELFLKAQYTKDIASYNKSHGTNYASYNDVHLSRRLPTNGTEKEKSDWTEYVRTICNLLWLRADPEATPFYREYLKAKYGAIDALNKKYGTNYASFQNVPLVDEPPNEGLVVTDWDAFLQGWKDPADGKMYLLPAEMLRIHSIDFLFRDHLKDKFATIEKANAALGTSFHDWIDIIPPQRDAQYLAFLGKTGWLKWEFITRNYLSVFDFLIRHGRGVLNTAIYCALSILAALIVNPLAAYALSRYKPPSAYKVLLFLMLTMAFPPMVTQIPVFLMLRDLHLLNTFWALILPGLANGYSIFLLKGFFDSLPQELYESAALDGAGEVRIFWQITMALSTPILAVIALGAFTGAYSSFLFALLICQNDKMWTLMVWLYQLQSRSGPGIIFASLIIAAIPTFLVFALCQNVIMRGIVVPVEK